jgi:hypothetical protein
MHTSKLRLSRFAVTSDLVEQLSEPMAQVHGISLFAAALSTVLRIKLAGIWMQVPQNESLSSDISYRMSSKIVKIHNLRSLRCVLPGEMI